MSGEHHTDGPPQPVDTPDEHVSWDDIETRYWSQLALIREAEDREIEDEFHGATKDLRLDLVQLFAERTRLAARLQVVRQDCDEKQRSLQSLETKHAAEKSSLAIERMTNDDRLRAWFLESRDSAAILAEDDEPTHSDGALHVGGDDLGNVSDAAPVMAAEPAPSPPDDYQDHPTGNISGAAPVTAAEPATSPPGDYQDSPTGSISDAAPVAEPTPSPLDDCQDSPMDEHVPEESRPPSQHGSASQNPTSLQRGEAAIQTHEDATRDGPRPPDAAGQPGPYIFDGNGNPLGSLKPIRARNSRISRCLELPLKRIVVVQPGRQFTHETLERVDEPNRWVSCMIQATGDVQEKPCDNCSTQSGIYVECVIVGGATFPRCGNCEWNRQACLGAAAATTPVAPLHARLSPHQQRGQSQRSQSESYGLPGTPACQSTDQASTDGLASVNYATTTPTPTPQPQMQPQTAPTATSMGGRSIPNAKENKTINLRSKNLTPSLQYLLSLDIPPPPSVSRPTPHQSLATEAAGDPEVLGLPEINRRALILQHDGMVFLEPEIMRGVPVYKITPEHAYWEPSWPAIEDTIKPKLDEWVERLEKARRENNDKAFKNLAGRQVNRGNATLTFMRNTDFHPYQLVGKKWMHTGIASYDTVYRLAATIEELTKFNLDIQPLAWLRQRLHEIYSDNPGRFRLDKIVHDLYRDHKLTALRIKAGYGHIGRPSNSKPKSAIQVRRKRKAPPTSATSSPKKAASGVRSGGRQVAASPGAVMTDPALFAPSHQAAGPRAGAVDRERHAEDLDYDGYTSTDSFSGDRVMTVDWRVHQVKTSKQTSNTDITQYWHWVEVDQESNGDTVEKIFEHQVLRDVEPISWGVYKDPIDFHLRLEELTEVLYAPDSQKIIVRTKAIPNVDYRGDVLAHFRRDRSKRRLLSFMLGKGVSVVRMPSEYLESAWNNIQSEVLPDDDSE